jgi:hypothetical protein
LTKYLFFFDSQFERFQPMADWAIAFGPVARQHIIVEAYGKGRCLSHSSLEAERERRGQGANIPFKDMLAMA